MFTVRQGMRYRATVRLGWLEKFASNEMIAGKLREVGFSNVDVVGQGGIRIAEATWPGEDITGPLDSHLGNVEELPPTVGAASGVVAGGGVAMAPPAPATTSESPAPTNDAVAAAPAGAAPSDTSNGSDGSANFPN